MDDGLLLPLRSTLGRLFSAFGFPSNCAVLSFVGDEGREERSFFLGSDFDEDWSTDTLSFGDAREAKVGCRRKLGFEDFRDAVGL